MQYINLDEKSNKLQIFSLVRVNFAKVMMEA